jgi:hypothetical protein
VTTFYQGHASAPDREHICTDCNRDLWRDSRRFRDPIGCPDINIDLDGKERCNRCQERHLTRKDGSL